MRGGVRGIGGDAAHGVGDEPLLVFLGCRNPAFARVDPAPRSVCRRLWAWSVWGGGYE